MNFGIEIFGTLEKDNLLFILTIDICRSNLRHS